MTRILLTNDDGVAAPGIRVLAEAIAPLGELVVVAPSMEQSGMGAALGPFYLDPPVVRDAELRGVDAALVMSVDGPPSLGVLLARLGAFGPPPELVVSGINPGLNVGRAVYHSGTVGATLTARNGRIHGIAVSQAIDPSIGLHPQHWDTAATICAEAVRAMLSSPPPEPSVLNLNVPDRPLDEVRGVRTVPVGDLPPGRAVAARLDARGDGSYAVHLDPVGPEEDRDLSPDLDTGVVRDGWVAMSWLGRIVHTDPGEHGVEDALTARFGG